jgi:putative tricarboxylic transport membrane protein
VADRVIFVCTILVAAAYFYATTLIPALEIGDPLGPKAFPRLLGVCLLIAAGLLLVEMWNERKTAMPRPATSGGADLRHLWVLAGVTVWTAAYYIVFERAGYIVATAIYLLALMAWFNRGKWITNTLSAVLFSILSYTLFLKLDVRLPQGILTFSF